MMPRLVDLELFEPAEARPEETPPGLDPAEVEALVEEARLASYESGYSAGWDDATAAQTETHARIGAELARNLEDLGFTLEEARTQLLSALEPVLREMVDRVLPRLMVASFGESVLETILPLAQQAADSAIEIVLAPEDRATVEPLLEAHPHLAVTIVEEPSLAGGQAHLRIGPLEREIDFASVHARISEALDEAFGNTLREQRNG